MDDPGELQDRLAGATERLLATAAGLTDGQAREPSLLPGWSRGHVLTHIARNADGLRNLLIWARTGVVTPQYPSRQARDDAIEAGSGRPASDLVADLRGSAAAFSAEAAGLPAHCWQASVHGLRGSAHPAWYTLVRRLSEVEIHHVDMAAGYQPADWPGWFVASWLASVAAEFAGRPDAPAVRLARGRPRWRGRRGRAGVPDRARGARAAADQDLRARLAAAGLADRPQLGRRPDRRPGWAAARGARVVVIQQTARIQQTAAFSAPPRRRGPGQRHGR